MLTRFDTYSDVAIDAKKRRHPEGRERTILVELCFICKSEVIYVAFCCFNKNLFQTCSRHVRGDVEKKW